MLDNTLAQIEEVEVLTQTSLQQLIDSLDVETSELEAGVFEWIVQLVEESGDDEQFKILTEALEALKRSGQTHELDILQSQLVEYQKQCVEIFRVERLLVEKEFQVSLEDQYSVYDKHLLHGEYSEAAWCLVGLHKMIQDRTEIQNAEFENYQSAKSKLQESDRILKQILMESFDEYMEVDLEKKQLTVKSHDNASKSRLQESWKAAEVLELVHILLRNLSQSLSELLLSISLAEPFTGTSVKIQVRVEGQSETLSWSTEKTKNVLQAVKTRFKAVEEILEFMAANVLFKMQGLLIELGNEMWNQIYPPLASKAISAGDGFLENEYLSYLQEIYHSAKKLELQLKTIGFLSEDDVSFSDVISVSSKATFARLSERFIKEARDLMIHPNWDTLSVGQEPVFEAQSVKHSVTSQSLPNKSSTMTDYLNSSLHRGAYQVSETAHSLEQIMESAAYEACQKGPIVLQTIIQCIEDICCMFESIFPLLHRQEIEVPHLGMLLANDYFYLSQALLKMPFIVPQFKILAPDVTFLNAAQQLHMAGKAVIEKMLSAQQQEVEEVLNQAKNFGSLKTGQDAIAIRKTSSQVMRILRKLGKDMSQMLAKADHCEMASALGKAVVAPILKTVQSRTDISAQESKELPKEVYPLLDEISPCLLNIPKTDFENMMQNPEIYLGREGGADFAKMEQWVLYSQFREKCPDLQKLRRLMGIWESNLRHIVEWWQSGVLEEEGFTTDEVRNLIWSLFEHSDKREEAIFAVTS